MVTHDRTHKFFLRFSRTNTSITPHPPSCYRLRIPLASVYFPEPVVRLLVYFSKPVVRLSLKDVILLLLIQVVTASAFRNRCGLIIFGEFRLFWLPLRRQYFDPLIKWVTFLKAKAAFMVRLKRRNLYRLQINPLLRRRLLTLYAQYLQQRVNAIAFGWEAFLWIEMLSNAWNHQTQRRSEFPVSRLGVYVVFW